MNVMPSPIQTASEDQRLLDLVARTASMLNRDDLDADQSLAELGIDSLNVVELILICEQIYPGVTDPEALSFDNDTTLRDLHGQLAKLSV